MTVVSMAPSIGGNFSATYSHFACAKTGKNVEGRHIVFLPRRSFSRDTNVQFLSKKMFASNEVVKSFRYVQPPSTLKIELGS